MSFLFNLLRSAVVYSEADDLFQDIIGDPLAVRKSELSSYFSLHF